MSDPDILTDQDIKICENGTVEEIKRYIATLRAEINIGIYNIKKLSDQLRVIRLLAAFEGVRTGVYSKETAKETLKIGVDDSLLLDLSVEEAQEVIKNGNKGGDGNMTVLANYRM